LTRKVTKVVDTGAEEFSFTRLSSELDFPCSDTKMFYHGGIFAFMWFLPQDPNTLVIKADKGYTSAKDPCAASTPLFSTAADFVEAKWDLQTKFASDITSSGGFF
jgi:hypothetical protein